MPAEVQRPIREIIKDLKEFLDKCGQTQSQIARNTGINQSTVHRALSNAASRRRMSKALVLLCKYANISTIETVEVDPTANDDLMQAIRLAWDGTEEHAAALARVIRELGRLSGQGGAQSAARRGTSGDG